jgi:hypothetical protein
MMIPERPAASKLLAEFFSETRTTSVNEWTECTACWPRRASKDR